jgi:hypothetical protein
MADETYRGGTNPAAPLQRRVVEAERKVGRAMSGSIDPETLNAARDELAQAEADLRGHLDGNPKRWRVNR